MPAWPRPRDELRLVLVHIIKCTLIACLIGALFHTGKCSGPSYLELVLEGCYGLLRVATGAADPLSLAPRAVCFMSPFCGTGTGSLGGLPAAGVLHSYLQ